MINPLHHHDEDGEIGVPILIPVPVVAVETTLVPAQLEPVAIRVKYVTYLQEHHPSNTLRVESNSAPLAH